MTRIPIVRHFVFWSRGQLVVALDPQAPWDWRTVGVLVEVWVGDDAAFPFRYVGYSMGSLPEAFLVPIHENGLEEAAQVIASNRKAALCVSRTEL